LPEQRVLVVDDEAALRDFVCRNLEVRGYRVEKAANGLQALAQFKRQAFDLVILDLMMPHMDGLETTRRLRQESTVPVVVLSALGEEADKVAALELGADDYLTKPFGVPELLARVKAVLRRSTWNPASEERAAGRVERDGVSLDLEGHALQVEGRPVDLTPIEFELLLLLMRNAGKVLTHRTLLQTVWGSEYGGEVEYLRVYVGRLRRKIEKDPSRPTHLLTEHGLGYRFV
jgi:two-component system KDP operon response regulator KdpE